MLTTIVAFESELLGHSGTWYGLFGFAEDKTPRGLITSHTERALFSKLGRSTRTTYRNLLIEDASITTVTTTATGHVVGKSPGHKLEPIHLNDVFLIVDVIYPELSHKR